MRRPREPWQPRYWEITHFDGGHFLTSHPARGAQIYRGFLQPSLGEDVRLGLRAIAAGMVRQVQGAVRAQRRRTRPQPGSPGPYLLLITPGTEKFAHETREVKEACAARGLPVVQLLTDDRSVHADGRGSVLLTDMLTAGDHARVLARWLLEVLRLGRWWLGRDRKGRSLSAAAIPTIRQRCLDLASARRIHRLYGRPRAVLTLAPWSPASVAVVEVMRARGVATGATRTQTTLELEEHLTVNAHLLFCKSLWERGVYGRLFRGGGPKLVDGCLLSLPEEHPLEPLALPEPFVLLLGRARQWNEGEAAFRQVCVDLERAAAAAELPIVYRVHPAHAADPPAGAAGIGTLITVADLRRNHELIARASLLLAAPSTLFYQAILAGTPIAVVELEPPGAATDEFIGSPLLRVGPEQIDSLKAVDLEPAAHRTAEVRDWFASNYFLDRGAGHMVDQLLALRG